MPAGYLLVACWLPAGCLQTANHSAHSNGASCQYYYCSHHPYRFDSPSSTSPTLYLVNQDEPKMSTTRSPPVIILLMGETGAGKSSFINTAAGAPLTRVGHDLDPCTTTVQHFSVQHPKCQRDVYFVDTPGLNHPLKDDGVILKEVVDWLQKRSYTNVQFGGIIYLYDLSQSRHVANEAIMRLKDPEPLRRVVLAALGGEGSNLETRLKDITGERVQIQRFTNSKASAWTIVDTILAMGSIQVGTIHDELARICNQLQRGVPKKRKRFLLLKLLGFMV